MYSVLQEIPEKHFLSTEISVRLLYQIFVFNAINLLSLIKIHFFCWCFSLIFFCFIFQPFFVKFQSYPSSDPVDPTDFYRPNKLWPAEAIAVYNKLNEDTKLGKWKRYISTVKPSGDGIQQFGKAADGKMFTGALFFNEEEKISKGVVTFQSWTEGPPG